MRKVNPRSGGVHPPQDKDSSMNTVSATSFLENLSVTTNSGILKTIDFLICVVLFT